MSTIDSPRESPWRAGLHSARVNLLPGLVLQVVALAIVLAYYQVPGARDALAGLVRAREQIGVPFAMASTGFFGGVLPFLYLRSRAATRSRYTWAQGLAVVAFWAYKGFEIDLWYRILSHVVGPQHDTATVLTKAFLDQFVYCPILAVPVTVVAYAWIEHHFVWAPVVADVRRPGWYRRSVLTMLVSNLGVWVPTVLIIFMLPTPLQLPLQNLVLCFFTLMLAHLARQPR